jgi:hypothetical protein
MNSGSDVFSGLWIRFRDLLFFGTPSLCPPGVFDGRGSSGTNAFACFREPRILLFLTAFEHAHCEGDVRPVRIGSGPYGRTARAPSPPNKPMSVANFVTENGQFHPEYQSTSPRAMANHNNRNSKSSKRQEEPQVPAIIPFHVQTSQIKWTTHMSGVLWNRIREFFVRTE